MHFVVVARQGTRKEGTKEGRKEGERLQGNFSRSMAFLHAESGSGSDGSRQGRVSPSSRLSCAPSYGNVYVFSASSSKTVR